MSAPDTNVKKQEKHHKPALFGMGAAIGFAALILAAFIGWTVYKGGEPEGAAVQIDSRTGEAVSTETGAPVAE
ncbi:hypothetical protein [Oceaniglobus ichthyenteri]|uniref:hypothetical protein n=1 Tax=Oceaniglobus ichthyenteri TaxID=2136177 RepID=UPI000D39D13E|nr:hypothetical protein [Oceaniglobus ichthyenteri]